MSRWLKLVRRLHGEDGQALVLFAAGLVGMVGLVAMSVDVGLYVYARSQMQSAVDAAALAAAQDVPIGTGQARAQAETYWDQNASFFKTQGEDVQMDVTFPPGNRAVKVSASADVPTWFARILGVDKWHVSADATAASTVLDIAMVLDISGSMCWSSYPPADAPGSSSAPMWIGPGSNTVQLTTKVNAGGNNSINIRVNSSAIFNSTSRSTNNANFGFNTTTRYYQYTPQNGRAGLIRIDDELFQITGIPNSTTLTVTRARPDNFRGVATSKTEHAVGAVIESYHSGCELSAPDSSGPYSPYDGMVDDAQYFTGLFNSSYDKIGLASFSSRGEIRYDLTSSFLQLRNEIGSMGPPNGGTNAAHGIAVGRQLLDGPGKRDNSLRVLVFLTDGRANAYCGATYSPSNYDTTSCPSSGSGADGNSAAENAARAEAQRLASERNTIIYTIGLGSAVDDDFLTDIAAIGGGKYFKAPTLAQLDDAFRSVAESTHIQLTQ